MIQDELISVNQHLLSGSRFVLHFPLFLLIVATLSCISATSSNKTPHPNILLLISDDQDAILGGTDYMPNLKRLFADQGVYQLLC